MLSIFQAAIIGLVQGLTELFPISSLGHSVILPKLLGWHVNQTGNYYLTFLVATHIGTALVLLFFFWREWVKVVKGIFRSLAQRRIDPDDTYAKLGWLLVVGTIPAGILGLLFQNVLQRAFGSAALASGFLIVNGIILFAAEKMRKRANSRDNEPPAQSDKQISKLRYTQSVGIGVIQSAALIPGISRSGASMAGSLLAGLNNEDAARFSFLLATPVIAAAGALKLPGLFTASVAPERTAIIVGALAAAVAAYFSLKFLVKFFQTKNLKPFAIYCVVAGIILSLYFALK